MAWPQPTYSKSQIRNAGKRVQKAYEKDGRVIYGFNVKSEDFDAMQNWRASHGAVLNTAQAWLRRLTTVEKPVIGQRLKRFETIEDKVKTGRSRDLSTMNDIAGVRAIFRSEEDLRKFQNNLADSRAKHQIIHAMGKFDYIDKPKHTGYRGVHQVYTRQSTALSGKPWNGLKFEVQLRTAIQHAWATAIEVYDSTSRSRFKFQTSQNPAYIQFTVISEIFARIYEARTACLPNLSDVELLEKQDQLENETKMISTMQSLSVARDVGALKPNTILQKNRQGVLSVYSFGSLVSAINALPKIEGMSETENAVLVGSSTPNHIRDAFRNYFDDTTDFVNLLNNARKEIGN